MTIHNFYIAAGGALWVYVLLFLLVKMQADRAHTHRLQKHRAFISRFFSPETTAEERNKAFKKLSRLVQDDLLLDYACSHYLKALSLCTPEEAVALEHTMKRLFHVQIVKAGRSASSRCFLLANLQRCGCTSARFHSFIQACGSGSQLEQQWASQLPSAPAQELVR